MARLGRPLFVCVSVWAFAHLLHCLSQRVSILINDVLEVEG